MHPINIFTFKWGTQYGPEYPNRLFAMLKKHIDVPFNFTCITDEKEGIDDEINIIDYDTFDPFEHEKDRVFTREKLVLFKRFKQGNNFWIDLDILIHNNITELVTRKLDKPTFIWNHWSWDKNSEPLRWFGHGVQCYVNSSFVGWTDDAGEFLFDALVDKEEEAFHTYKSLDKYLFYQHWRKGHLAFWEPEHWYNYNFSDPPYTKQENMKGCIFNTSHIRKNNLDIKAFEIHETKDWALDLWKDP